MKRKLGLITDERYWRQYLKYGFAENVREVIHGRINVLANSHTSFIAEAIFNKKSDHKAFYIVIAANACPNVTLPSMSNRAFLPTLRNVVY